jgi:hypothetical protein
MRLIDAASAPASHFLSEDSVVVGGLAELDVEFTSSPLRRVLSTAQ